MKNIEKKKKKLPQIAMWVAKMSILNHSKETICQELQIEESLYQSCLQEEGYQNYLKEIEEETLSGILERCADTKSILSLSSSMAALICAKAAISGSVGNQTISPSTQLKAAQDILDRTGHSSKASNNLVVIGDVESLVEIYEKRKSASQSASQTNLTASQTNLTASQTNLTASQTKLIEITTS